MEENIKDKFQQLHDDGNYPAIVELVEEYMSNDLEKSDQIFLKTQQGRALNNLGKVDEGLPILIEVDGLEDGANPDTKYRIAYSYYHMDKPIMYKRYFDECLAIEENHEWAMEIIEHIKGLHLKAYQNNPPFKKAH